MNRSNKMFPAVVVGFVLSITHVAPATADTVNARCDIYPIGKENASASLPCTFSQRQGYITIQRTDGIIHDLSPSGDQPGNYLDQSGKSVYRQSGLGKAGLIFRMPTESVYVYWDATSVQSSGSGSGAAPKPPASATPSFDCSKASHAVEKLVCTDDKLATFDRQLAEIYATTAKSYPADELDSLKSEQLHWIKRRNACPGGETQSACVRHQYEMRITELQIQGGALTVPEAVHYRCGDGDESTLTAVFYQKTALPAVTLTRWSKRAEQQVIAFASPTGSGTKYQRDNVLFWTKGKEAMLTWGGKEEKCVETGRGGGV